MTTGTAARTAAVLFVVTAALFVVGVATEPVLGVDVESPGPIAAAVIVSALLVITLWSRPLRIVALAALVVGVGFAVFDTAEVANQLDENRNGFALLAGVVAAGHAAAALLSGRVAWNRT